jgi:uncharacterized phiE125 gp8 family phage protein
MIVKRITEAIVTPVSLADVKAHTRIESTADDTLLAKYLKAAWWHGEGLTNRCFVAATWELPLEHFPTMRDFVELPMPPLQSVESFTYVDLDGVTQTLVADTDYYVDADSEPGRVFPVDYWPTDCRKRPGDVRIRYISGYPLTGEDLPTTPEGIQNWLMVRVAGAYEQRENFLIGVNVVQMPRHFCDALLDPYIIIPLENE